MRGAVEAAHRRQIVLRRPWALAVCYVAAGCHFFAAGYRDPGNDDSDCSHLKKEGCHKTSLLAVTASGHLLVKDHGQSKHSRHAGDVPGNGSSPESTDDKSTDDKSTEGKETSISDSLSEERDREMRGIARLFSGEPSAIFDMPFFIGATILLVMLIAALKRPNNDWRQAENQAGDAGQPAEAAHQAPRIDQGHVLKCTAEEAEIYATVDSSEVIRKVMHDEEVEADGPPVEHAGTFMLPVKPEGVVKLELFRTNQAADINEDTVLMCISDASQPADVFQSTTSTRILHMKVPRGQKVVAKGKPEWVEGYMMLPIKPSGAVEADLFEVVEAEAGEAEKIVQSTEVAQEGGADDGSPEMADIKARMKQLKKEKTRLMFEQASRKEALTGVLKSIMEAEAELEGLKAPSEEEAMRKAEEAMRSMDAMAEKGVLSAFAYAAPIMVQSKKIYSKFEERLQKTQDQARKLAMQESKNLVADLTALTGLSDLVVDQSLLDSLNTPSLAALVASALAPAQLRLLYAFNMIFLALSLVFILLDVVVVAWDWQVPCMNQPDQVNSGMQVHEVMQIWWKDASTNAIYMWFFIDFFVHFLCAIIRWRVVSNVGGLLEVLEKPPPLKLVEHPVDALRLLVEYSLSKGAESLIQLDEICSSCSVYLASWSVCFDLIWLIYAVDVTVNTPWSDCACIGLVVVRVRSLVFLMLIVLYILQIASFCLSQMFQSQAFTMAVVRAADKADDVLAVGIPVFKILVHALMVRGSSDMIMIQLNMHQMERDLLQTKREHLERELGDLERDEEKSKEAMEKLESEKLALNEMYQGQNERAAEFAKAKKEVIENSEKFFEDVKKKSAEVAARAEQQMEEIEKEGIDPSAWTPNFAALQEQGLSAAAAVGAESMSMDAMMAMGAESMSLASQAAQDAAASSGVSASDVTGAAGLLQEHGAGTAGAAAALFSESVGVADLAAGSQGPRSNARVSGASESQGDDAAGSASTPAEGAAAAGGAETW